MGSAAQPLAGPSSWAAAGERRAPRVAIEYSTDRPAIDPHGDYFTPITYRVLEPLKGVAGSQVTVLHRARWPSPTVDETMRLRADAFGSGRPLVVFARADGAALRSRDREMEDRPGDDPEPLGVVAATRGVVSHLQRLRR